MSYDECFMCGKTNRNILAEIEFFDLTTQLPESGKQLNVVLEHLANCIKTKLIFSSDTTVCNMCFQELADYDQFMVHLMKKQKVLTTKLKSVLSVHWKQDVKNEAAEAFVDDSQLEDVLNPDLDTKEEDVQNFEIDIIQNFEEAVEHDAQVEEEFILGDEILLNSKEEIVDGDEFTVAEFIEETDENSETIAETIEENQTEGEEEDEVNIVQPDFEYIEGNIDNLIYLKPPVQRECQHCGETFKSKVLLRNHVLENHKVQVFACKICGIQKKDEEYLELHMNIHSGKTEFECRICDKKFSRPVNTLRHMRKHWDKKGFQCEKCGERFSLDNMLYNHKKRHEAEENPLICAICNQHFKSMKTYNHHQLIHQENRPRHQCPICPKSFTERYTLKMHMNVHPSGQEFDESKSYEENTCVICEANFPTKDALITHLKDNHDVVLK